MDNFPKNKQYIKFCAYGFLKNLRFFDAFLLLFFLEKGISYTQIGVLYALREIIINVLEIPSGIIADTYGRKHSLLVAFLFYILSFILFYYSSSFYLFLFAMTNFAVGDAFRSGTHKGMIMDYLKLNNWGHFKVAYYGHTRSWSQKGSAISALIAGFLVLYSGNYEAIFLYSILPYLLNLINIYSYPSELNFSMNEKGGKKSIGLINTFKSFVVIVKRPKVFQIMNSTALHSAFLKAVKDYIQPVMVQVALFIPLLMELDIKRRSGLVIGIFYFFIFLLTSYASKIAFKVSNLGFRNLSQKTLLAGFISGLICGILYHQGFWALSLIAFIFIYILENLRKPLLTGEIADHVPYEILTSVLSAQSFFKTIMTAILAIIFGVLADRFGIGISLISVSGLLLMLTFFVGKVVPKA